MTPSTTQTRTLSRGELRAVVQAASLAPSIHNTQPWRWVSAEGGLDLYADPARRLPVADPTGRQLLLSCGAALLHARLAVRRLGLLPRVRLCPGGEEPVMTGQSPAASIRVAGAQPPTADDVRLTDAITRRHTDRRPFTAEPVSPETVRVLRWAAELEGAWLVPLTDPDRRIDVSVLTARADWLENHDPAYRHELAEWSRVGAGAVDGIPRESVVGPTGNRAAEFVLRDFDVVGQPGQPLSRTEVERPTLLLVGTDADRPYDQLTAGQAIGRVLLAATADGLAASFVGQAIDLEAIRPLLAEAVSGLGHVQMLIRIGYPLPGAAPLPATPRRDVADVLAEAPAPTD